MTSRAKPDIPPSYEVHVSPSSTSGTTGSEGPDYFGFDLKAVVAKVYGKDVVPEVSAALRRERRKICAGWLGHLALGSPGLRHAERAVGCRPSAVSSAGPPLLQRSRILCRCKLCDKLLHGVPFFRDTCLGTHIIRRLRTLFHFGCGSAALSLCVEPASLELQANPSPWPPPGLVLPSVSTPLEA